MKKYLEALGHFAYGWTKEKIGDKVTGAGLKSAMPTYNPNMNAEMILGAYGKSGITKIGRVYEFESNTPQFNPIKPKTWTAKGFTELTGVDFEVPKVKTDTQLFRFNDIKPNEIDFKGQKFSNLENVQPKDYGIDVTTGQKVGDLGYKNMPEPNKAWIDNQIKTYTGLKTNKESTHQNYCNNNSEHYVYCIEILFTQTPLLPPSLQRVWRQLHVVSGAPRFQLQRSHPLL